jgi:hypothetical protein
VQRRLPAAALSLAAGRRLVPTLQLVATARGAPAQPLARARSLAATRRLADRRLLLRMPLVRMPLSRTPLVAPAERLAATRRLADGLLAGRPPLAQTRRHPRTHRQRLTRKTAARRARADRARCRG